jgi:hypothetical protein
MALLIMINVRIGEITGYETCCPAHQNAGHNQYNLLRARIIPVIRNAAS